MAKLKALKQKDKRYAFKAFDNDQAARPAIAVFSRFPGPGETFYSGMRKGLIDGIDIDPEKLTGAKREAELEKIKEHVVQTFLDNLSAGRIDYHSFIRSCIDRFEEFGIEGKAKKIETANEFLDLPADAVFIIASELYVYAMERDEFTMGESKA
jgi:hypothetical protein